MCTRAASKIGRQRVCSAMEMTSSSALYLAYISPISRLSLAYLSPLSRLYLACISPLSRLYLAHAWQRVCSGIEMASSSALHLAYLSPISRLYLACTSPLSRLYLASISPISRPRLAEGLQRDRDGLLLGTQRGVLGPLDPLPGIGEI